MDTQQPTPNPSTSIVISIPKIFTTMNPDAFFTFLSSAVVAFLPVLVHMDPQLGPYAALASDFCNTLSKDLAGLGIALHLDGK